jgi:glycogen(starch) synthase
VRILFVTNLYPPLHMGGYEIGCREVAERLQARGHEVHVLTSTYGLRRPRRDGHVSRTLYPDPAWTLPQPAAGLLAGAKAVGRVVPPVATAGEALWLLYKETHNQRAFRHLVRRLEPDLIYAWNFAGISISLLFLARSLGLPTCAFVSDHWLAGWKNDLWYQSLARTSAGALRFDPRRRLPAARIILASQPEPLLDRVQFVSDHIRTEALGEGPPVGHAETIHWGVDLRRFRAVKREGPARRLLYVGQIVRHKGVHTIIEALASLPARVTLTIMGDSTEPGYMSLLQREIANYGVGNRVTFTGVVAHEQVGQAYREHDVLLFPSVWQEPFSIGLLEAMASGMPVVATLTGGTSEVIQSGHNGLAFEPEDAAGCANAVKMLLSDPALSDRLGKAARETVAGRFDLDSMVDKIEDSLTRTVRPNNRP